MGRNTLLVDTGAWFALVDESDEHHNMAVDIYPKLLNDYHHLTTTNLVIAETYILISLPTNCGSFDDVATSKG